jgi:hypothetical protein
MPEVLFEPGLIALLSLAFQSARSSRKEWGFVNPFMEGNSPRIVRFDYAQYRLL